jgi:hypothetical protein
MLTVSGALFGMKAWMSRWWLAGEVGTCLFFAWQLPAAPDAD